MRLFVSSTRWLFSSPRFYLPFIGTIFSSDCNRSAWCENGAFFQDSMELMENVLDSSGRPEVGIFMPFRVDEKTLPSSVREIISGSRIVVEVTDGCPIIILLTLEVDITSPSRRQFMTIIVLYPNRVPKGF